MRTLWLLLLLCCAGITQARRSEAVFILQGDGKIAPEFFRAAERYHSARLEPGQDLLVTSARSLEEVREWLSRSPLRGSEPWGRVTLIAHGSPWRGALVAVWRDAPLDIATASGLRTILRSGEFPPLDDAIVDAQTELNIESCGLGRRPDLLVLYAELLGGRDTQRPRAKASAEWIEYGSLDETPTVANTWRKERAFVARVVPVANLSERRAQALRKGLQAQLQRRTGNEIVATPVWQSAPAHIEIELGDRGPCAGNWPLALLVNQPRVREVLRDHALEARDLAWQLRRVDAAQCVLEGNATIAVVGAALPSLGAVSD